MASQFQLSILFLVSIFSQESASLGDFFHHIEGQYFHSAPNAPYPILAIQSASTGSVSRWRNVPSNPDWEYFADGTVCAIGQIKSDAAGRSIALYFSSKASIPDSITLSHKSHKDRPIPRSSTNLVIIDDIVMPAKIDGDFGVYAKINVDDYRFKDAVRRGREMTIIIGGRNRGTFSLRGSSAAFEFISPCLNGRSVPTKRGLSEETPTRDQKKGSSSTIVTHLGKPEECSGFDANLKLDGKYTYGLSVKVYGRLNVELLFSDYQDYTIRALFNEDSSLEFSDGNNSPLWVLRCYEKGGVLYENSFRDNTSKIYELNKSKGDIFDYALEKGIDLRH
jgi:hypothetical protein